MQQERVLFKKQQQPKTKKQTKAKQNKNIQPANQPTNQKKKQQQKRRKNEHWEIILAPLELGGGWHNTLVFHSSVPLCSANIA